MPGLGESMFVWMSKDPNGPRFTPELLGLADCFGHAGLLVGVVIFNKFLRSWKYRDLTRTERMGKPRKAIPPRANVGPIQPPMVNSFSGCSWICCVELRIVEMFLGFFFYPCDPLESVDRSEATFFCSGSF